VPKNFPEQLTIDGLTFNKSTADLYLEMDPQATQADVDRYLNAHSKTVDSQPQLTDHKAAAIRRFNRASLHSKWVVRANHGKGSVDDVISTFDQDKAVAMASPIYFRPDLKQPNGFALSDQIIVRLKGRMPSGELDKALQDLHLVRVEGLQANLGPNLLLLRPADRKKQTAPDLADQLAKNKYVESAHVDMVQLHTAVAAVPNDTYLANQWNLSNLGQTMPDGNVATPGCDIDVEPAWDISKGSPLVVIAVLDTGCDLNHPDLAPHLVQPERWFDAHMGTTTPNDDCGHGTCCSGIAAALTDSLTGQGIAGVGWNCRVMPVRMVWNSGYSTSEAVILSALNHARNNHANVITMSWIWTGATSNIDAMLLNCFNAGIVLVAASGNNAPLYPDTISYPASNPNVIAVGATNENDRRCTGGPTHDWPSSSQGSQYGPQLSVVAPGVHTWATDMQGVGSGYNNAYGGGDAAGDYFEDFGGTSGAAPHVAGLAGLVLAYNPTLAPGQVRSIIETTADDQVGDPAEDVAGWDKYMGHGRINAYAALKQTEANHPFNPVDVLIRDSLTDNGAVPYLGSPLCYSPDIIVRESAVPNPQAAFADMTVDPGSDPVEIGNDNYIYIRVQNKGAMAANVNARIYYAPLNTTCAPDLWEYLGQVDFYNVAAGGCAVSDALVWHHAPDPGAVDHYCVIASIEGPRDPHPDPAGVTGPAQYMQFIRDNNNICYRNLVFQNLMPDTAFPLNFMLGNFLGSQAKYDLRIVKDGLALGAKVKVKLARPMFPDGQIAMKHAVEQLQKPLRGYRVFELDPVPEPVIKGFVPGKRQLAQLEMQVPPNAKPGDTYRLMVQQMFEGQVIGDFVVAGTVVDPAKTKFVAVRGTHFVHKTGCKCLTADNRLAWVPFDSVAAARSAGYDMALDCLNERFIAKDVSRRLVRRVLNYINEVDLPDELNRTVAETLGKAYFEARYGPTEAKKRGFSIGMDLAKRVLEARDAITRFTALEQLEAMKGMDQDRFIDLVNAFK